MMVKGEKEDRGSGGVMPESGHGGCKRRVGLGVGLEKKEGGTGNAGGKRLFLQCDGKGVEYPENLYIPQTVIPR